MDYLDDVWPKRWVRVAMVRIAEHCVPESTFTFEMGMASGKAENHMEAKHQL